MSAFDPRTWFKRQAPAVAETETIKVDTSIVSVERPYFGGNGSAFPRQNLDSLAAKKTLRIYESMRLDEQVKAAVTFKRDAILSRGWTFEFDPDSKLSDAEKAKRKRINEQIVRKLPGSFIDSLNVISVGREYGFSLTEKVYQSITIDGADYVGIAELAGRNPCSFQFFTDEFGRLIKCEQEAGGRNIPIDLDKFIHYVHNPEFDKYFGRSDLREAHRSWYFKEMMIRFWGLYMEKLGGGVVIASIGPDAQIQPNTPNYTALQTAVSQMKASPSVVLPVGVTAKVVFPTTSDAFEKACTWHDLAIAKALLVPNLAGVSHTGQTGAYSQAQSQLEAFAWTLKADAERLQSCIDEQLFRDLGEQNWGDDEYPCFTFKPMSGEAIRALIDTWCKLVGAGAVIASEVDEDRIREILEMPPRDKSSKPLVDPAAEDGLNSANKMADKSHQLGKDKAEHAFGLSEKAKDADIERQAKAAEDAEQDPKKKKQAYARAKLAATLAFGFNPEQPRGGDGRWTADGASADLQDHLDRELDGMENGSESISADTRQAIWDAVTADKLPPNLAPSVVKGLREALKNIHGYPKQKGMPPMGDAKRDAKRLIDYLDKHHGAKTLARTFGFNPDQERDDHGRWAGDGEMKNDGLSDKALSKAERIMEKAEEDGSMRKLLTPKTPEQESQMRRDHHELHAALHQSLKEDGFTVHSTQGDKNHGTTIYRDGDRQVTVSTSVRPTAGSARDSSSAYRPGGSSHQLSEFLLDVRYGKSGSFSTSPRDARISIASARERVDFAVLDRKQTTMSDMLRTDVSTQVARAVKKLLGSDEEVKKLTDTDTRDIANVQLDSMAVGRIKAQCQKALIESYALGARAAREEIRRTRKSAYTRDAQHFADIRENAAGYFDSNGFRMAGNVADGTRSIIQAELLTSVKVGRSPAQTRTAIWERLVAKGFSSRESVQLVETDEAVNAALDALWVDDEVQAAHYLDTLARTNLFEAMNEARYAEFSDPALGDFVVALRYSAILDDRTTEICTALHDHVWRTDSENWDEFRPPNHFNCRSILVPITQLDVEDGLWDGTESEDPDVAPQAGFGK